MSFQLYVCCRAWFLKSETYRKINGFLDNVCCVTDITRMNWLCSLLSSCYSVLGRWRAVCSTVARVNRIRTGSVNLDTRYSVRTLVDTGSQCISMRTFYDYGTDIVCLFGVRLPNAGSRCIKVLQTGASYWMYHSEPEDNSRLRDVTTAMYSQDHSAPTSWEPVSSSFAMLRFNVTVTSA